MRLYKTGQGQAAFKQRSALFSARQRSLFILFDGKKELAEVLTAAAGLGMGPSDVEYLLSLGFLSQQPSDLPPDTSSAPLGAMSMAGALASAAAPLTSASAPLASTAAPAAPASDPLASAAAPLSPALPEPEPRSEQQRYFDAKPIATQLTASLGLRGLMLNLAVEGAAGYPDLLRLLPKIQDAVGAKACRKLERILLGQPLS